MKKYFATVAIILALTACKELPNQTTYSAKEVGVARSITLATVQSVREVPIIAKPTDTGMLLGAGAGAGGGSYVGGDAQPWAIAGGAVLGAVAGYVAEQNITDRTGLEYILSMDNGEIKTITQEKAEGDVIFKKGDRVLLQSCDAGDSYRRCAAGSDYQRLLPTDIAAPVK
jgi:outer membrane lipoprotein SlyB